MTATLSELTIGSLTLSPAFDPETTEYTAATSNATNKVTAVASDPRATVVIKNGETEIVSGESATWAEGENTLTVTVTAGELSETYTVTVTKS